MVSQLSSTMRRPRASAIRQMGSMSQGMPARWTGMIARVRGVIRSSILAGSIM